MLLWFHGDIERARQREPEDVLRVVRDTRRVAVAPVEEDLVAVLFLPVDERVALRVEPRLLADFAHRRSTQRLPFVLAAGDRLPEAGAVGALEQQHLERRRVHHYKD